MWDAGLVTSFQGQFLIFQSTLSCFPYFLPFLDSLPFLLFGRSRSQLKRMDPSRPLHLFLQQGIHHPVSRRLHLRFERLGRDEQAEMSLFGDATLHCLVVRMHAGVVVDFECGRMQGCGNLYVENLDRV